MGCALHVRGEGLSSEMLRGVSEAPSMQTGVLTNWLIGVVTLGHGPTILHAFPADHKPLSANADRGIVRGGKGNARQESKGRNVNQGRSKDVTLRLGALRGVSLALILCSLCRDIRSGRLIVAEALKEKLGH